MYTFILYLITFFVSMEKYIQSAKILLLPPKYEIIIVPSNHSNFQYCDSNIGLFTIASCKVNILNPVCILSVSVLCSFSWISLNTERKPWTNLQNSYKNWSKEIKSDNFCCRKVGRVITKWGAIEKSPILLSQYWQIYHF